MSIRKCIWLILTAITLSNCTTTAQTPTLPSIKPIDLLLSSEDLPVGWKSYDVFSDEYDDLCYIDCAIIQFSPVEENGVSAEENIYVYYTLEEAAKNYQNQ